MSNYTKSTNFATKDNLTPGDPLKVVRGTEIDTEFNNIATAVATKTDNSAAAITGGSIAGITDLAVADGGTGASTATAALNNLLPSQTGNANKYLQTDGTNATWDAVSLSTADITGTLPVANGGTGVTSSTGTGSVVLSNSPTLVTPALGTPASGVATNLTGLPISTGVSGLGTGVATFLGTPSSANLASAVSDETGTGSLVFANSPTLVTPALGTPSALVGTNITGTASGLTAGNVTTNANLTGAVTSVGNATSLGSFSSANLLGALTDETGTGSAVFATSPTLVTPILGTPTSATLTNATGLPIATGVSGLGTGVATALAVNVGSAGAPVVNGGALGTPSSGTVTNLTGTASININGTVGSTTPTTGAFTTLAASGAVTLSGGTANGVTYLNGSKVLTTGSALTFNGTTVGINTSVGNSTSLSITGDYTPSSTATFIAVQRLGGAVAGAWSYNDAQGAIQFGTTTNHSTIFLQNNAEAMRLTSTGLGIGTSSPAAKLEVNGGSAYVVNTNGRVYIQNGNTSGGAKIAVRGTSETADGYLAFETYSREFGRFDSAGNLGLGVTPSAWYNIVSALQVKDASIYSTTNTANFSANEFVNSSAQNIYKNTGFASLYAQNNGSHKFFTAASGTAGNPISFTQAMTLDADGRLAIGTTTPLKFNTSGSSSARLLTVFNSGTNSGTRGELQIGNASTTSGDTTGLIMFGCGASTTTANQTAIIYSELTASSTSVAYGALVFGTANGAGAIERARIDSSGNLLVGKTSTATTAEGAMIGKDSGGCYLTLGYTGTGTINSTAFFRGTSGSLTQVGSISTTGSATAYNTSSDYRLKNTIAPMTGALAKVALLKPCTYKWNADGSDGEGFIAHELAEVVPQCVTGEKDAVDEEGNPKYQGIDTSFLVATLTAAIQELKAEFDAYKASHP